MTGATGQGQLLNFIRVEKRDPETKWLDEVTNGKWDSIPLNLPYEESGSFAMLLDGYRVAKKLVASPRTDEITAARKVADNQHELYKRFGEWRGSAAELWVTLFFKHRADRFVVHTAQLEDGTVVGGPPRIESEWHSIVAAIRAALLNGKFWPDRA